MKLDQRDLKIISILRENCRISNTDLAGEVGMSTSACWRRVKMFEESGLIERYGARIDPLQLGLTFSAIVHVQLTRHNPKAMNEFLDAVPNRSEVHACFATTGQADYHLIVRCRDIETYNRFLEEFLFRLPAVRAAQTNVVLREIKPKDQQLE